MITTSQLKDYLGISGSAEDTRLGFAVDAANAMTARFCGLDSWLYTEYLERFSVTRRGTRTLFTGRRFLAQSPRLVLSLYDSGFEFPASAVSGAAITRKSHGLITGDGPYRLHGSDLPAGFAAATDYWAVRVDDDTINLATSSANASAGTVVTPSDSGTGIHTLIGVLYEDPEEDGWSYWAEPTGVVRFADERQIPLTRLAAMIYTAGLGSDAAAVATAYPELLNPLLTQAAFMYQNMGTGGRLGEVRKEFHAAVTTEYLTSDWAPGVRAQLRPFQLRRLF